MISLNRHMATSWDFSVQVGKAFTHPEKVQTPVNIYIIWPLASQESPQSGFQKEFL
jgi:hypothetical protein